jgi:hypothetical protein
MLTVMLNVKNANMDKTSNNNKNLDWKTSNGKTTTMAQKVEEKKHSIYILESTVRDTYRFTEDTQRSK